MRTRSQSAVVIDFDAASAAWRQNKIAMPNGTFIYSEKKKITKKQTSTVSTKTTRT